MQKPKTLVGKFGSNFGNGKEAFCAKKVIGYRSPVHCDAVSVMSAMSSMSATPIWIFMAAVAAALCQRCRQCRQCRPCQPVAQATA